MLDLNDFVEVKQFRFMLTGKYLNRDIIHAVTDDWIAKELKIKAWEIFSDGIISAHEWADAMIENKYPDEILILSTYANDGTEIYYKAYEGLKLIGRTSSFVGSVDELTTQELTVSYKTSKVKVVKKKAISDVKSYASYSLEMARDFIKART